MSDQQQQILQAMVALTEAAEKKARAEAERVQLERERLSLAHHAEQLQQENNALLNRIVNDTTTLVKCIKSYAPEDHDNMLKMLQSILALVQVIALRVSGSELNELMDTVSNAKGATMQVTVGDHAQIKGIVEGTQYVNEGFNVDAAIVNAVKAINEDSPEKLEEVLNTLPEDAMDVAIAALNGPITAARMIARKVSDKWRVTRAQTGLLRG